MSSIAPPAHTRRAGKTTDNWITPRWIIDRLGPFDLDPCACDPQPWPCAKRQFTHFGLIEPWVGMVWLNPPYGRLLGDWLRKMAAHNHGIALTFARTDTKAFHEAVWPYASGLLFLRGRISFHMPDGKAAPNGHNSGGPSVLISYGIKAFFRLKTMRDKGALVIPSP